jgi:hypothetical protein
VRVSAAGHSPAEFSYQSFKISGGVSERSFKRKRKKERSKERKKKERKKKKVCRV